MFRKRIHFLERESRLRVQLSNSSAAQDWQLGRDAVHAAGEILLSATICRLWTWGMGPLGRECATSYERYSERRKAGQFIT